VRPARRARVVQLGLRENAPQFALLVLVNGFVGAMVGIERGAVLLGIGTAMVYPTLLAAIGDIALPAWRASSVGVYRLWRDLGYAFGALAAGVCADVLGLDGAMWIVAALTFASGLSAAFRLDETWQGPVVSKHLAAAGRVS
jgi:MFS family permease